MSKITNNKRQIYTLGMFDILENGQSLVMANAASKKIWELYKFMLTHREQIFTPEALLDQLWMSESYNDPRGTLRRQMHRLRQALGESADEACTIEFSNGYYRWSAEDNSFEIDVDQFEKKVSDAVSYEKEGDLDNAIKAYLSAIELYKGDYLPDLVENHWVFSVRYHYRRVYLKSVLGAVALLMKDNNYDEILSICSKAMKIDVYEEPFHIYYMEALASKGDYKQALEHYEHITGFFYREMGIKPSDDFKTLYKKLLQNNKGGSIDDVLSENEQIENAFYCESEVFKSIFELERRRCERSGDPFTVGILEVPKGTFGKESEWLLSLKQYLMRTLRKGDALTQWSVNQLAILLPGVDASLFEKVMTRVLSNFDVETKVEIVQVSEKLPVERKVHM